jgi:hypothetical protein
MGKVNIDIKKIKTQFIDGRSGKELTKEEFQQRYGKVKPSLQDRDTTGDDEQMGADKEAKGGKGEKKENA